MVAPNTILQERYLIIRQIGQGGMGAVYMARDQRLRSVVALKESFFSDERLRRAFVREAELLANLHHPALPNVIDHFTEDDRQFLVMQFITGEDLGAMMEVKGGPFSPEEVTAWADQLLDSLDYLHTQEPPVIHRDIKPQNLKLTTRGQIILLDFGLAKGIAGQMSAFGASRSLLGYTPNFAPLEQIQGAGTDARSDLYALAATLYYLLTGTVPPDALMRASSLVRGQADPLKPASEVNQQVPAAIAAVLYAAMAQNPDERPQTAALMREALRAANQGQRIAPLIAELPPTQIITPASAAVAEQPAQPISEPALPPTEHIVNVALARESAVPPMAGSSSAMPPLKSFQFNTVTLDATGKVTDQRTLQAQSFTEDLGGGVQLEMVEIPAGTFTMGSPSSEWGRRDHEGPQHQVTVPKFYMGKFEVTQAQWRAVTRLPKVERELEPNPSSFKGNNLPVERVSWEEAVEFCERLSKKTGREYRLPSEAEWEYAARAGAQTPFAFGETITPDVVNFGGDQPYPGAAKGIYRARTVAVGSLGVANRFGLYDLHGNVLEWCLDYWHENYNGAPVDGSGWVSGGDSNLRVSRGGSWCGYGSDCRSASRPKFAPDNRPDITGFRIVAVARS